MSIAQILSENLSMHSIINYSRVFHYNIYVCTFLLANHILT